MTTKAYVLATNKKAIAYFLSKGIKLTKGQLSTEKGIYYGNPGDTYYYTRDVYFVDLPAKGFHDLLVSKGLLS